MEIKIKQLRFESHKILKSLSIADQEIFHSKAQVINFKKGKLLFYDQGIPTGAFLLKKGKAKIFKTGIYGKDQIFYIYKPGDLFGYHALLADEKYEDSCEALEDCEVLFISKSDFKELQESIKNLKSLLIQNMSHEFGVLVNTITILAQKSLRERLAIYLLLLNDIYNDHPDDHSSIDLSREDFANIIGTTRESLGRLLKELREDNLIEIDKRKIRVKDRQKVYSMVNSAF